MHVIFPFQHEFLKCFFFQFSEIIKFIEGYFTHNLLTNCVRHSTYAMNVSTLLGISEAIKTALKTSQKTSCTK